MTENQDTVSSVEGISTSTQALSTISSAESKMQAAANIPTISRTEEVKKDGREAAAIPSMTETKLDKPLGPPFTESSQNGKDQEEQAAANPLALLLSEIDVEGPIRIKNIITLLGNEFPMDDAVIKALPQGSTYLSVAFSAVSAWTLTARVETLDLDGNQKPYFLKVAFGEHGRIMLNGEFESSKQISKIMPDFIPQPIGFGKYKTQKPATYFYLSDFVDMDVTSPPDAHNFCSRLAEMHKRSQSPTGKFGFHVTTCDGKVAHTVRWEESWAIFFQNLLLGVCKLDLETNGPWPNLERATKQVVTKVIPRLLGVLQTKGRQIKPSLIHGDLWEGNMGINQQTGDTILFDAGSYYAHHEMELGHWRCAFSLQFRDEPYWKAYKRHYPASEPKAEFEDRIRLYSLKGAINYAAGHPESELRAMAYNDMCYLCEKYAPLDGIDKYDPQLDPIVAGTSIVPHVREGLI
ncbi:fructosamine kinase [Emydomyces testavorans]|uniref:protein-ribulosamine 3-kinase n=1 Tax=Emydomyces testavorans TaxID=2070801 RepID=A0AAF0IL31_9EURO|nr:fructosamine kinase [Emydomyces testavorans]